jgi:hypothetical protein
MSVKIVAPVVVKPEIDSKKASVKLSADELNKYGREPNALKSSQIHVLIINPSLVPYTFSSLRRGVNMRIPQTKVMSAE